MQHPITRLISEGEHQQLDFKFEIGDAHKIARTLSAFANTDGGKLLVGVKDNGALAGIRSEEECFMVEAAASLYCRPPVEFSAKEWEIGKKTILEVTIPKSSRRPHFARAKEGEWVAYHRVKDQNFPVNRILLRVWELEGKPQGVRVNITDPERFLLEFLDTHDSISLSKYTRLAGISRRRADSILVRFILLRLVKMNFSENLTFFTRGPAAGPPDKT